MIYIPDLRTDPRSLVYAPVLGQEEFLRLLCNAIDCSRECQGRA